MICNQIAPDNYDKKFDQLRNFIFGNMKYKGEAGYEKELKIEEIEKNINYNNIEVVVESIFKKA